MNSFSGFDIEVRRSNRRKTATLEVMPGEKVVATIPETLSDEGLQKLLKNKLKWIIEKTGEIKGIEVPRKRELISGEAFPLLGKEYRLKITTGPIGLVQISDNRLLVVIPEGLDSEEKEIVCRKLLSDWYKVEALKKIEERVAYFSERMGLRPESIKIKDLDSRWGLCHSNGRIDFNWKIIAASPSLIDYIVVHELAHLKFQDHSSAFKKLVGRFCDYEECRKRLLGVGVEF